MNKTRLSLFMLTVLIVASIYLVEAQSGSITNLTNTSYGTDHIKWTWKDPKDTNFSRVMIYINGEFKENVSKGKRSYNATDLETATEYTIGTHTVDKKGHINPEWINNTARTAIEEDKTPPESVKDLDNTTHVSSYINWVWKDPPDSDFAKVKIYINGEFTTNVTKGVQHYNATNLTPNTNYKISTRTVDLTGNINKTQINHTATAKLDITPPKSITNLKNITYAGSYIDWTWQDPSSTDFAKVNIYINGEFITNVTKGVQHYNATDLDARTEYTIGTHTVDNSGNVNKTWKNHTASTSNIGPKIIIVEEPDNLNVTIGASLYFDIRVDQDADITWKIGNNAVKSENILADKNSNYTFKPDKKGTYNIKVIAENDNGTDTKNWIVTTHRKTYFTGNRIWDGSKPNEYSLTYTWNPMSFSGFYYDINSDVGNENITIALDRYDDRNIEEGDIIYSTAPEEVSFGYYSFGKYQVIGFMADKYFAGYTDKTKPPNPKESVSKLSVIAQGQLHKILLDDDDKRILTVGSTISLKEGYTIKAKDVGDRTVLISLLKDGSEVDAAALLDAGETYVYKKRVGSVNDLPIIMVRFETVFMGTESQMAILKGIFQISEDYDEIDSGDRYGVMEITEANENKISMENSNSVSLSTGSTIDLMGNLKILVADDSSAVRFALFSEKTGTFDVRGTIYPATDEWSPMNFGLNIRKTNVGFYYDIDEDIGTERLSIKNINDRSIPEGKLEYSTSPQDVSFDYSEFGDYSVIGFMADKYFAGYTDNSVISDKKEISTIGSGQLHKVLLDDEEKRVISVGSTLTLKEGYVLKAKEIDIGAGNGQMWVTLLKDGNEIDNDVVATGDSYVYKKKVGSVDNLPIIAVHIDSVFRGREVNAAFIKGIFQITNDYTKVGAGDDYGIMEVTTTGQDKIVMENKNSISLSSGNTIDIMGNIKFRVADSGKVRFYPFVRFTQEMVTNQLIIDAPSKVTAGDTIRINITAGGSAVEGADITIEPEIGLIDNETNFNGTVEYTLPIGIKGTYNITATKSGYEKASRNIEVNEYIKSMLSIDMPTIADQFDTITIHINHNNVPISGVNLTYDNTTIGVTDNDGKLNYTLQTSGTHTITASKIGYISASRDIEVKMPFSEFKALDINIIPEKVFTGDRIMVRSNITNVGTKGDSLSITLIINDTEADSKTVTLSPKETKEIDFNRKIDLEEGNYTIEILGQNKSLEVRKKPLNIPLIVGIIIAIGAIVIYLLTKEQSLDLNKLLARFKK